MLAPIVRGEAQKLSEKPASTRFRTREGSWRTTMFVIALFLFRGVDPHFAPKEPSSADISSPDIETRSFLAGNEERNCRTEIDRALNRFDR